MESPVVSALQIPPCPCSPAVIPGLKTVVVRRSAYPVSVGGSGATCVRHRVKCDHPFGPIRWGGAYSSPHAVNPLHPD